MIVLGLFYLMWNRINIMFVPKYAIRFLTVHMYISALYRSKYTTSIDIRVEIELENNACWQ